MPKSPSNRSLLLLLGLYTLLLLLPAGSMPLMESTEARYAEIAREMVVSGNYLEPYFNGIKHFHKPPLPYWLVAAGFKLFGLNDFGARFFGVLATALGVFYLYRLARLLLGNASQGLAAATIFGSSVLMLVVSRLASTEIYLTVFTIAAQFYLFRQLYGERGRRNAVLFGLFLGLGFFTKGPIIFLFTLLPFLVAKCFDPAHRRVFSWGETAAGTAVFAALALPWYLLVIAKNPGLLDYFVRVQTVDRVVTDRFRRYEPPWYFLPVFIGGCFPYALFLAKGLGNWRAQAPRLKLLWLYIAAPLLVFSLAKGKHATYILPFFGVAAVIAAGIFENFAMPRLRAAAVLILAPLAVGVGAAGFFYRPLAGEKWLLIPVGVAAAVLLGLAWRQRREPALLSWLAGFFLLLTTVGIWGAGVAGPEIRGYEKMAGELNRIDPPRRLEVLVYRGFLPSLSFYRNRLAVMALGDVRETQFQPPESYRRTYLDSEGKVGEFLAGESELFVVARPDDFAAFSAAYPYACREVFTQHRQSAYQCRRTGPAAGGN